MGKINSKATVWASQDDLISICNQLPSNASKNQHAQICAQRERSCLFNMVPDCLQITGKKFSGKAGQFGLLRAGYIAYE